MNKRVVAYGLTFSTLFLLCGGTIWAFSRKHNKRKEEGYSDFREQLEKTKEPEKITKAELSLAFDPTYWKNSGESSVISAAKAEELALQIEDAWSIWDDDEEQVYEAFEDHNVRTFADVSRIADVYRSKAIADIGLWEDLTERMNAEEMAIVKRIVANKLSS